MTSGRRTRPTGHATADVATLAVRTVHGQWSDVYCQAGRGEAAMRRCLPRRFLLPLATLLIALLALVSCTRSPDADADADPRPAPPAPPADDGADDPEPPEPPETGDEPSATLEEQAIALWEDFHTERLAQLTSDADPDAVAFDGLATEQGTEAAIDLIFVGRGELAIDITEAEFWPQVEIAAAADRATVEDCILIAEQPDGRTDLDPTVKSQVWTGTLIATEDGWLVDHVVPGVDNCVAPELNRHLLDAYQAYHEAWTAAWDPPDPDHPLLGQTMVGERLEGIRQLLRDDRADGIAFRDPHDPLENAVVFDLGVGQATVSDCHPAHPDYGAYDIKTGGRLDEVIPPVEDGQLNLVSVDLVRQDDGSWKVAQSAGLDGTNCTPRGTDYVVAP